MKKQLKDWDIVAHIIPIGHSEHDVGTYFGWSGKCYRYLAVYINRYGLEIGRLCKSDDGDIVSMDPILYEEYIENKEPETKKGKSKSKGLKK